MKFQIRKWLSVAEDRFEEAGQYHEAGMRKVGVVAILANPFLPGYKADLQPWIDASALLGDLVGQRLVRLMGDKPIQGYGKAGVVGVGGEQEHANALLTTTFANPIRSHIGGGKAWIPSVTKVAAVGATVDVPLAHKDALYVRSHYDTMGIHLPDGPMPDEVALIFVASSGARLNARVGGLRHDDVVGENGLI